LVIFVFESCVINLVWLSGCQEIPTDSNINIMLNNIKIVVSYILNVDTLFVLRFRRIISAPFSGSQSIYLQGRVA
jgi:hypothetical protein